MLSLVLLSLPVLANAGLGPGRGQSFDEFFAHTPHGDKSLLADHDATRERIKLELAKLESQKKEHDSAHDLALLELEALEGHHDSTLKVEDHTDARERAKQELAKLANLHEHDHEQMKLDNDAARERVKQELAKLSALQSHEVTTHHETLRKQHSNELAKLEIKDNVFNQHKAAYAVSESDLVDKTQILDAAAARARAKEELAKLEALHDEEWMEMKASKEEARERAQQELAKLKNLKDHDHEAMKADNSEARERVKKELAKLEAMKADSGVHKAAYDKHAREMSLLDAKHKVLETHGLKAGASSDHEEAKTRAMAELAKLREMHRKAISQPKGLRGTTAKHVLQRDLLLADGDSAGLSLAQTSATLSSKRGSSGGGWMALPILVVGGVCIAMSLNNGRKEQAAAAVRHTPFKQHNIRSKAD